MIRKTMITILALLSCHTLFSQAPVAENFAWPDELDTISDSRPLHIKAGPKVGLGISLPTDPSSYNIDFQSGIAWQFGATANFQFIRHYTQTHNFGVQAELLYSGRTINSEAGIMTMNCVEIPILFQYYPMPSLALEVGPTIMKVFKTSPDQMQFDNILIPVSSLTGSDLMITFGMAYSLPIGLMFDLRYNLGTSNMAGNLDSKVSTAMASVVYLFSF